MNSATDKSPVPYGFRALSQYVPLVLTNNPSARMAYLTSLGLSAEQSCRDVDAESSDVNLQAY